VNLLAPGQLDAATKLVVTNAAYFKATWTQTFDEERTRPGPFLAPQGVVTAQLMEQTVHHGYGELPGAQVVELGYWGGDMVTRIAVPRDPGGLRALEASAIELLSAPLRVTEVHLVLPRFRVESCFLVACPLAALGMRSLFSYPDADLSGIDGTHELYVSSVVHKAFVATDEHGTEATAATAMSFTPTGMPSPEPIVEVRVDRPFLFWIVHPSTGTVLFCGRVLDPS
jgi:serpin B